MLATLLLAAGACQAAPATDAAPAFNYSLGLDGSLLASNADECADAALDSLGQAIVANRDLLMSSLDSGSLRKGVRVASSRAAEPRPAPVAEPVTPPPPADPVWEITVADKTLNAALSRWASSAGWQLLWELPVDYAVEARTTVPGNFDQAVRMVIDSMASAQIPMKAVFYQGNKVLRIMVKGSE
jgi:hypothetical protein